MKITQKLYNKNMGTNSKKGPWSPEEDQKLTSYIMKYRIWNWNQMPKFAGLSRTGKSCRLRWVNYLRPDLKRGPFSMEEVETVIRMYQSLGNRWSAISKELPGRTDNEIKNFFHTHLKKQLGTKVNDHVQVKPNNKARCKRAKKAKELEMRTRGETQEKPNQSLDMSSSDITFDENHKWDFTNFSETSSEDNYCVNSLVNQEAFPIIDSMVILESNPTTSEDPDFYVQDFRDVSVNSSNVDFWLELYMAAENLAG